MELVRAQGKAITAVAAAKRHTVVLTEEGDVYTWGHRVVTPRRVPLAGGVCRRRYPQTLSPEATPP